MNIEPFQDTPFGDDEAFEAFQLAHGLAHERIASVMIGLGNNYNTYPLYDTPDTDRDWKLFHYIEHQSIYHLLKLDNLPDLSTVNFDDEGEFTDWMQMHTLVHTRINATLGIV